MASVRDCTSGRVEHRPGAAPATQIDKGDDTMAVALPRREDVPRGHTWNLESIFPTVDDWRASLKEVEAAIPTLDAYQGHLGDSPEKLRDWFNDYQKYFVKMGQTFVYSSMLSDVDTGASFASGVSAQWPSLYGLIVGASSVSAHFNRMNACMWLSAR